MNKTQTASPIPLVQLKPSPQPAKPNPFIRQMNELAMNVSMIQSFMVLADRDPRGATAPEIEEVKRTVHEVLRNPNYEHKEKEKLRYDSFCAFSEICMFTDDESARRAAQEARESVPFPFSKRYGRVRQRPNVI